MSATLVLSVIQTSTDPAHPAPTTLGSRTMLGLTPTTIYTCDECGARQGAATTVPLLQCFECGEQFTSATGSGTNGTMCPTCLTVAGTIIADHSCPVCKVGTLESSAGVNCPYCDEAHEIADLVEHIATVHLEPARAR